MLTLYICSLYTSRRPLKPHISQPLADSTDCGQVCRDPFWFMEVVLLMKLPVSWDWGFNQFPRLVEAANFKFWRLKGEVRKPWWVDVSPPGSFYFETLQYRTLRFDSNNLRLNFKRNNPNSKFHRPPSPLSASSMACGTLWTHDIIKHLACVQHWPGHEQQQPGWPIDKRSRILLGL